MKLQEEVQKIVEKDLWPRDKILLKMTEELGEVSQAFRKKSRNDQLEEIGDLGFALICLCIREEIDFETSVAMAVKKHRKRSK